MGKSDACQNDALPNLAMKLSALQMDYIFFPNSNMSHMLTSHTCLAYLLNSNSRDTPREENLLSVMFIIRLRPEYRIS